MTMRPTSCLGPATSCGRRDFLQVGSLSVFGLSLVETPKRKIDRIFKVAN
jgi:hypothetical protein